jgi:hypothetical protein
MARATTVALGSDWIEWLQALLIQAVNLAFRTVSGSPADAIESARRFCATANALEAWIETQAAPAAAAAALYIFPFIHLKALVPEVVVVFKQMGKCAWGVGYLSGCCIDGKADLEVVMGIWSEAISEDRIDSALRQAQRQGHLVLDSSGLHAQPGLGAFLAADGETISVVAVPDALAKAAMAKKIALKVAAKLLPKFAMKASVGALSLVGALWISKLNRNFVRDFGRASRSYYRAKRLLQDSLLGAEG